ncbi:MAG: energy-coupling factor ABC transporter ATP-binding protein [Lachnospiraceae bacterium]|nr:energy-coupling factor ABC transporter ATP-binding protein [Lachnospiraceae bacterium]
MKNVHIDIENLTFSYGKSLVLKDITIHAHEGETIGIIGQNGAGKSTLLKLIVGLYLDFTGEIKVEDILVKKKNLSEIRKIIGYVFQDSDSQLFMSTAYEDVAFAPRNYGLPEEEVEERTLYALERVGALGLRDKQIYKMSGGEKKLVSIATILSMTPDIMIMDEPSVALDPKNRRNLIKLMNSFDKLKIITSHDLDFVMDTCTRVILIDNGSVIQDGKAEDILQNEKLLEAHGLELPLSLYHKRKGD